MSNLQPNCCLEFDFRKVDQHAGGKWLIHDTKRRKDNQLQSLKLPCRISKLSSKMWHKGVRSTVLNPIFSKKVQGQKLPGRWRNICNIHWFSHEDEFTRDASATNNKHECETCIYIISFMYPKTHLVLMIKLILITSMHMKMNGLSVMRYRWAWSKYTYG